MKKLLFLPALLAAALPAQTLKTYTVTNPATFPGLPLPSNALIFLDGNLQLPGLNYSVGSSGTTFKFLASSLKMGDHVTVVSGLSVPGPQGPQGVPGVPGAPGANGVNGNTILNGVGYPGAAPNLTGNGGTTAGNPGDFWIDTAASVLYGPKQGNYWPTAGLSLVGPQGPAGANGQPAPLLSEIEESAPAIGAIDGTNKTFTLSFAPAPNTLVSVYLNGLKQSGFTISGTALALGVAPTVGDSLAIDYKYQQP